MIGAEMTAYRNWFWVGSRESKKDRYPSSCLTIYLYTTRIRKAGAQKGGRGEESRGERQTYPPIYLELVLGFLHTVLEVQQGPRGSGSSLLSSCTSSPPLHTVGIWHGLTTNPCSKQFCGREHSTLRTQGAMEGGGGGDAPGEGNPHPPAPAEVFELLALHGRRETQSVQDPRGSHLRLVSIQLLQPLVEL